MAGSVNKVILVGNLGRDPEIRFTQAGKKIANFSIATSESWKDRQSGERRERTEWHRIVVFNEGLADVVERFVKKGSKLYIEGVLRTRKWQGQDGKDNYTTEIVLEGFNSNLTMLDNRGEGGGSGGGSSSSSGGGYGGGSDNGGGYGGGSDSGWGNGGASGGSSSGGGSAPAGAPDLDDEIPF
ncbi:single-stranded DNA-binding protein [Thalassospira alkalitolerans]|uniref:Single-stranded DNA-binding protein n=1 Tax=Thalassospira alkalitolerans TaxID=1293890 RepID=A0A1Y2LCU2_9PROT|nr:single-stranded DNA-binding protein [Thalassospira alkalitolerans]OSQ48635.1 single-stranded DNA-binding protein [Thalassospira alkalitolerans]|tara:strand:- start:177340 stop:177888 length:549 start_codon:yes stop_codon:yes gene_type:complete